MEGKSRAKLKELSETEDVCISSTPVNLLDEFFRHLRKCEVRREELRKELRAHRGFYAKLSLFLLAWQQRTIIAYISVLLCAQDPLE